MNDTESHQTERNDDEKPQTLEALATQRAAADRIINVWVEGNTGQDPPEGRATAMRVAHLLTEDDCEVVEPPETGDTAEVTEGDTILLTLDPGYDAEDVEEMMERLIISRPNRINTVVHAQKVPEAAMRVLDVRVIDTSEVRRIKNNPFEGDRYEEEMAGLVEVDNGES